MVSFFRKIGFFVAFILPAMVVTGFYLGGTWNYITLFFAFLVLPLVDQSVGTDTTNVPKEHAKLLVKNFITGL